MLVLIGALFALPSSKYLFDDGGFIYVSEAEKAGREPFRPQGWLEVIAYPIFFAFWAVVFFGPFVWLFTR